MRRMRNTVWSRAALAFTALSSLAVCAAFIRMSELKAAAAAALAFALIVSWRKPAHGLYLLVFTLPFSHVPAVFGSSNLALAEPVLFAVLAVFCVRRLGEGEITLRGAGLDIPILAFTAVTVLSSAGALQSLSPAQLADMSIRSPAFILRVLLVAFESALIYFLTVNLLRGEDVGKAVSILLASALIAALYGFTQLPSHGFGGVYSFFNHPNSFAMFLAMVLPLSISASQAAGRKHLWALPAALLLALLLTYSRGAFAGLLVSMAFLWFSGRVGSVKAGYVALAFTMLAFVSLTILIRPAVIASSRSWVVEAMPPTGLMITLRDRALMWNMTLGKVAERPLGYGYVSPGSLWGVPLEQAHSLYLQLLLEKGVFGLLAFLWILVSLFRVRLSGRPLALAAGLVAYLVHGLVDYSLKMGLLFFLFLALIEADKD